MVRRSSAVLVVVVVGIVTALPIGADGAVSACGSTPSDFDGDGRADLAVGIPDEIVDAEEDAGAVHVIYGSGTGLTASGDQFLHQNVTGMAGTAQIDEFFGSALAAGDFDGDGRDDLAVGIPVDAVGVSEGAGSVQVIYGSAGGLTTSGDQIFNADTSGMAGEADGFEQFGAALAACDFDGDGRDDLAIGIPSDPLGAEDAGSVHVIYGSATGLTASGDQVFGQIIPELGDQAEPLDHFGDALAAGDFDNDGRGDLAIGVSEEDVSDTDDGLFHVLRGSSSGLTGIGNQIFHQDTSGVTDQGDEFDWFAFSLAAGDFDGDGRDDLAVGVPQESSAGTAFAGAVHIFYGSSSGLTASGDQRFHEDTSGITDAVDEFEEFGIALAVGDFDADGRDDLGVGTPGQDFAVDNVGAVHVIYGSADGLTASGDQFWHQDVSGVTDSAEVGDNFGMTVSAGDFDGDGRDDLVAGVVNEDIESPVFVMNAGAVHVLYGSTTVGLTASGDQIFHQDTPGIADSAAPSAFFGSALIGSPFANLID